MHLSTSDRHAGGQVQGWSASLHRMSSYGSGVSPAFRVQVVECGLRHQLLGYDAGPRQAAGVLWHRLHRLHLVLKRKGEPQQQMPASAWQC